jgi:hypothetical protein
MVGSLAALVGVAFLALMINHPFAGGVSVDPEPFERVLADSSP